MMKCKSYFLLLLLAAITANNNVVTAIAYQKEINTLSLHTGTSLRQHQSRTGGIFKYDMLSSSCLNFDWQQKLHNQLNKPTNNIKAAPFLVFDANEKFVPLETYSLTPSATSSHWTMKIGAESPKKTSSCVPWENPEWETTPGCKMLSDKINSVHAIHTTMLKPFHDSYKNMYNWIKEANVTDPAHNVKCGYVLKLTGGNNGLCDKFEKLPLKTRLEKLKKFHSDWEGEIEVLIRTAVGRVLCTWSTMKMPKYNPKEEHEVSNAADLYLQYAAESTLTDLAILTKKTSKVIDEALANDSDPIGAEVVSTIAKRLKQDDLKSTTFDKNERAVLNSAPMRKAVKTLGLMLIGAQIAAKLDGFGKKAQEKPSRTEKLIDDLNKQIALINKQIQKNKGLGGKIKMPDFVVECATLLDANIFHNERFSTSVKDRMDEKYFTDKNIATYVFDIWAGKLYTSRVQFEGHAPFFTHIKDPLKKYLVNHHDQEKQNMYGMEVSASSSSSESHTQKHGSLHDLKCLPTMFGTIGYSAHYIPKHDRQTMKILPVTMPFLANERQTLESMLKRDKETRPKVVDDGPKQAKSVQPSCARYVLNQFLDWNEESSEFYDLKINKGFFTKIQAQFKNITGWKSSKTDSVNKDVRDQPLMKQAIDIPSKCVASQVYAQAAKKPARVDANCRMWQWCVRAMVSRICPTEPEMKDYIARLGKHQNPQPAKAAKPGKT